MIVALIPARGGSKGIPGKNLRLIAGKPLLAHSIDQARKTPCIDRVIVSTDNPEIGEVAREHHAEVVWRPAKISGDNATSESALIHALDRLSEKEGRDPELVVFLQATSPMRRPWDIQRAVETLRAEGADSLLSVGPLHGFVWRKQGHELQSFTYDFMQRQRRQDAPEDFVENGSIYIFKPWVLRQCNNRLGGKIAVYNMRALDSFQVDEPEDLELMEVLMAAPKERFAPLDMAKIKLLALDFDGVLTDNRVLVMDDGREAVFCTREDGFGLEMLKGKGIEIVVISQEKNPVVSARCRKLDLACVQACKDKLHTLREIARQRSLWPEQIAYVGDGLNDLECMRWVGWPIAVSNAGPEARAASKLVTGRSGGHGAVREICELLLQANEKAGA